jgi:hypothetical protein
MAPGPLLSRKNRHNAFTGGIAIGDSVGADYERAGSQLNQGCKDGIEVAFGARVQDMEVKPEGASYSPHVFR